MPATNGVWLWVFAPALVSYVIYLYRHSNIVQPSHGSVDRFEPHLLDRIIPPNAKMEVIARGFSWAEGPVWVNDKETGRRYILFSDVKRNNIWRWEDAGGLFNTGAAVFMDHSGCDQTASRCTRLTEPGSNGLAVDPKSGLLVICEHGNRQVSLLSANSTRVIVTDAFEGKHLNSPNDLAFTPQGHLYFTDPSYGLNLREADAERELDFNGLYRISAEDLHSVQAQAAKPVAPQLLEADLSRPNGLAFSPDYAKLYVANSGVADPAWHVFDVDSDGSLKNRRLFANATHLQQPGYLGGPDGLKVDDQGNVIATGPGGVVIFNAEGLVLGRLLTGVKTGNVVIGDDGFLYITADSMLQRIRILTKPTVATYTGSHS